MKSKMLIAGAVLSIVTIGGLATANSVGAMSNDRQAGRHGQQQSMQVKADALGVDVSELTGKNWKDIAKQKGIDEQKVFDAMRASAQKRWESRGLTQEEIDQRTADMEQRQDNCDGSGENQGTNRRQGQRHHRQ